MDLRELGEPPRAIFAERSLRILRETRTGAGDVEVQFSELRPQLAFDRGREGALSDGLGALDLMEPEPVRDQEPVHLFRG